MRKLQLLLFSLFTLFSASAFACGPMFADSFEDRIVVSGLLAILHVVGFGFLSGIYLLIVSRFQHIRLGQGVKFWFGSMLVAYVAGAAGNLVALYAESYFGETHAVIFAVTFPLVALVGYFTRIERRSNDRFEAVQS